MDLFPMLARFHDDFPMDQGYRVTSDLQDGLALCSGRLALASSSDQRLPIEGFMISTHRLLDKDGHVLRDARAMRAVSTPEDLVALEEESLTRLLIRLGYNDGLGDSAPATAPDRPAVVTEPRNDGQNTPLPSSIEAPTPTPIPLSLQRRLDSLAHQLGKQPPTCTSLQEANRALLELNAQLHSSSAGPAEA